MAKKVLIVDDDPIIVKYLKNVLEDNGYESCSASNGKEAYEVLKAEKPDMITLDLEMPEEWGTRFFRKITKEDEYKDIPALVISGLPGRHLALKNVVGSMSKPFDPDKVIAVIRKTIGDPK
ncbi:Response regulator protein [Desulfonema limicola]|uniref:Response regulator protein n=1 Tax=Desulfonema limicola TaxID=45656 RepID=A0A975BC81_9BACT|nr:response regulator [Desulfonema limicola]QTA82584.1 Response regulator protein [Desulfonema limicola]